MESQNIRACLECFCKRTHRVSRFFPREQLAKMMTTMQTNQLVCQRVIDPVKATHTFQASYICLNRWQLGYRTFLLLQRPQSEKSSKYLFQTQPSTSLWSLAKVVEAKPLAPSWECVRINFGCLQQPSSGNFSERKCIPSCTVYVKGMCKQLWQPAKEDNPNLSPVESNLQPSPPISFPMEADQWLLG